LRPGYSGGGRFLVPINANTGCNRGIVCVPHAGAGAASFMRLGRLLDVAGWAARFPGRESRMREAPLPTITAMADQLAEAMRNLGPDELVLFGHCCGALVAYEAALRLQDWPARLDRLSLVASACAAPFWRFDESAEAGRSVAEMSDEELTALLAAAGGTDEELLRNRGFVELMLPVYRADVLAVERYERDLPRERLHIPVLVLAGNDDADIPRAAFSAWAQVTDGPFEARLLPGGHFYLNDHERTVANLLQCAFTGGRASRDGTAQKK
jgi:surfactin synthase thioesterase subunit